MSMAVGIFGGGSNSGGGGGGASAAEKALVANATQYGLSYNLYKVMEEVKKDPRTQGYSAIMLCQYYKGYNKLSLEGGADAFLTSDGDFYQGNTTHYWHDSNDEHFDRWVAMLFSSESGSYTCSNANICPRAALIDGTMGDIIVTGAGMRFQWIDVTDDSSFGQYRPTNVSTTTTWAKQLVLNGMRDVKSGEYTKIGGSYSAIIGVKKISAKGFSDESNATTMIKFLGLESITGVGSGCIYGVTSSGIIEIIADQLVSAPRICFQPNASVPIANNLRHLSLKNVVSLPYIFGTSVCGNASVGWASLIHIEIGNGFHTDLNIRPCTFANCLLTDANNLVEDVVAHPTWSNLDQWLFNFEHLIVDKLADLSGQTAKTITLAAAPYAAITSEIRAKMSAKNWNLASA